MATMLTSILIAIMVAATSTTSSSCLAFTPPSKKPSLVVFDLDNTLWTPELYQLRKLQRQQIQPIAGRDVTLFDGARNIINSIQSSPDLWEGTQFAVASRTKSVSWAHDLLNQFGLDKFFGSNIEIFPGDKKAHFESLRDKTGIPYDEMLFFDDARDGRYGNCVPVANLGVLCAHTPSGIYEEEIFHTAMKRYAEDWSGKPNTIIEWDGSISENVLPNNNRNNNNSRQSPVINGNGERLSGTVKNVVTDRRFGFIRYGDRNTKDLFFHFNNIPNGSNGNIAPGDELSFVVATDPKNGKTMATNIEIENQKSSSTSYTDDNDDDNTVKMRVFSMNNPFAALLANGYKTIETRNGTMFTTYPEGTKMLLHVGRRTYPDGNKHMEIMKDDPNISSEQEIEKLKSLPPGFSRGMAVAIVELGRTYDTTLNERCDPTFQRNVGAYGADSGRRATEIKRVEYLKRGVKVTGQGGVFKGNIPRDVIPDGWLDDDSNEKDSSSTTKTSGGFYASFSSNDL